MNDMLTRARVTQNDYLLQKPMKIIWTLHLDYQKLLGEFLERSIIDLAYFLTDRVMTNCTALYYVQL